MALGTLNFILFFVNLSMLPEVCFPASGKIAFVTLEVLNFVMDAFNVAISVVARSVGFWAARALKAGHVENVELQAGCPYE